MVYVLLIVESVEKMGGSTVLYSVCAIDLKHIFHGVSNNEKDPRVVVRIS